MNFMMGCKLSYLLLTILIWNVEETGAVRVILHTSPNFRGVGTSLVIDRCENLPDEFNDKISSARTNDCVMLHADYCCQGMGIRVTASADLSDTPFNNMISSVSPCGSYSTEYPKEIIETWDGHNEIMTQVVGYNDVAIYYNDQVKRNRGMWGHAELIGLIWGYTKEIYGNFGPEGSPLYAFFHAKSSRGIGSTTRNFFDRDSKCRNLIDLYHVDSGAWSEKPTGEDMDSIVEALARIVEWSSKGVYYNPLWGGDKVMGWGTWMWTEIFIYDVYTNVGMEEDALRVLRKFSDKKHDDPEPHTYWFRDWFYPIYSKYGGSRVLNNYFEVLSHHFPRGQYELEWRYEREMNLGEYVHLFSGAVGVSLRDQAAIAFRNWDDKYEREFLQAKRDFPRVRYAK